MLSWPVVQLLHMHIQSQASEAGSGPTLNKYFGPCLLAKLSVVSNNTSKKGWENACTTCNAGGHRNIAVGCLPGTISLYIVFLWRCASQKHVCRLQMSAVLASSWLQHRSWPHPVWRVQWSKKGTIGGCKERRMCNVIAVMSRTQLQVSCLHQTKQPRVTALNELQWLKVHKKSIK